MSDAKKSVGDSERVAHASRVPGETSRRGADTGGETPPATRETRVPPSPLNRRGFLNAGLLATGGVAGWLSGCDKAPPPAPKDRKPLDQRFTYDISEYQKIDPAQLLFSESGQIPSGLQLPACIAIGAGDLLYVGGDQVIKIFDKNGNPREAITLAERPQAVVAAEQDRVFVAFKDHFEAFDAAGKSLLKSAALDAKAQLTSIAIAGEAVFVADAGNREVVRFDAQGKVAGRFGKLGSGDGNPGFLVPSPYFHLLAGSDGLLWVSNPGRHQVQAYTLDGKFELGWGQPAMCAEGFCGCCNPANFARMPDGRFVTSEKGLVRIKVYDAKGKFLGMVAGPSQLVKNEQTLSVYRVACDSAGRVLALQTVGAALAQPAGVASDAPTTTTSTIRIFVPKQI